MNADAPRRAYTSTVAAALRLAFCMTVVCLAVGLAAHAIVPEQVEYQGLLLDDQGDPISGNVAMAFELFDAAANGTSLWTEAHPVVTVTDGVYSVALGSSTPLTPAVLASGNVFLEVSVGGEVLTPRQQLLAVPYALRATDTDNVDGLSSTALTQIYAHVDLDGGLPPNDDPREGLGDSDGDGLANFVDPDNDDDGISDAAEVAGGSDINVITPIANGTSPGSAPSGVATLVSVLGANFDASAQVVFGSQTPAVTFIDAGTLEVQVGPQGDGPVDVEVSLANGETATASQVFSFIGPTLSGIFPPGGPGGGPTTLLSIFGTNFAAGATVDVGTQSGLSATFISTTELSVEIGPQPTGLAAVSVTVPGGASAQSPVDFVFRGKVAFVSSTVQNGALGGVAGADATCTALAAGASLPGPFIAWIADGTTDPVSRLDPSPGWEDTNGNPIAADLADLTDGTLLSNLQTDENGAPHSTFVWTNVASDGTARGPQDCGDWQLGVGTSTGRQGYSQAVDQTWTDASLVGCNVSRAIYCFAQ